jgi:metallo-beta-lactamase class B
MTNVSRVALVPALGIAVVLAISLAAAQIPADVERHIAAAKAAAGSDHVGLFDRVCTQARDFAAARAAAPAGGAPAGGARAAGAGRGAAPPPPARDTWYAEPVKVFDNLYYVGEKEYSAWAVTTSAGIILIDAIFDYSVEDEVVGGLKKLGLDPAQIKYVIVSHAHADHAAGAKLLQERFGARVVMGAADYDLLDKQNPAWKPKRDIVATDGYTLTLGDTTLTLTLTPGHTLGTISTLVPVRDGGRMHVAAAWGGTAFNFGPDKDRLRMYIDSSVKFGAIVQKAGADVLIANHTVFDGSKTKIPALATRKPGAPHPYVIGPAAVRRYLTVANECAQAALAALS